jgi:hypothetical protein
MDILRPRTCGHALAAAGLADEAEGTALGNAETHLRDDGAGPALQGEFDAKVLDVQELLQVRHLPAV